MENIFNDYVDSTSAARKGVYMAADEKSIKTPDDSEKRTYSAQEIADILQISRSMAYNLFSQSFFKTVRVGNYIRVSKPSFDKWLDSK